MGAAGSKIEDVKSVAASPINYSPPLGAPNPGKRMGMATDGNHSKHVA